MSDLHHTIGRVWDEVCELDWDGWYPLLEVRRSELLVVGLIEADREDLSDLVPVCYEDFMVLGARIGYQHGFMRADMYRALLDEQTGGMQ